MFRRGSRKYDGRTYNTGLSTPSAAAAASASFRQSGAMLSSSAAAEAIRRHSLDQGDAQAMADFRPDYTPPVRRTASMTAESARAYRRQQQEYAHDFQRRPQQQSPSQSPQPLRSQPQQRYSQPPAPRTNSISRANSLRTNSMTSQTGRRNSLTRTHTVVNRDSNGRTLSLTTTTIRQMGSFELVSTKETPVAATRASVRGSASNGSLRRPQQSREYADSVHSLDSELGRIREEPEFSRVPAFVEEDEHEHDDLDVPQVRYSPPPRDHSPAKSALRSSTSGISRLRSGSEASEASVTPRVSFAGPQNTQEFVYESYDYDDDDDLEPHAVPGAAAAAAAAKARKPQLQNNASNGVRMTAAAGAANAARPSSIARPTSMQASSQSGPTMPPKQRQQPPPAVSVTAPSQAPSSASGTGSYQTSQQPLQPPQQPPVSAYQPKQPSVSAYQSKQQSDPVYQPQQSNSAYQPGHGQSQGSAGSGSLGQTLATPISTVSRTRSGSEEDFTEIPERSALRNSLSRTSPQTSSPPSPPSLHLQTRQLQPPIQLTKSVSPLSPQSPQSEARTYKQSPSQSQSSEGHHYRQLLTNKDDDAASITSESSFKRKRQSRQAGSGMSGGLSGGSAAGGAPRLMGTLRAEDPARAAQRQRSRSNSRANSLTGGAPQLAPNGLGSGFRTYSLRNSDRPDPARLSQAEPPSSPRRSGGLGLPFSSPKTRKPKSSLESAGPATAFKSRFTDSDSEDEGGHGGNFLPQRRTVSAKQSRTGNKLTLREVFSPNSDARVLLGKRASSDNLGMHTVTETKVKNKGFFKRIFARKQATSH